MYKGSWLAFEVSIGVLGLTLSEHISRANSVPIISSLLKRVMSSVRASSRSLSWSPSSLKAFSRQSEYSWRRTFSLCQLT